MARLALCAVGLALAAAPARAGHGLGAPGDQTGLFQIGKGTLDVDGTDQLESDSLSGGGDRGYVPEDYVAGMVVETRMPNGTWVHAVIHNALSGNVFDIKIPGQDLQGVPAKWVRRRLGERESDWLVADKGVQLHVISGIKYRLSKDLNDVDGSNGAYAPFNSYVTGRDEGDGWVKVSQGYLPKVVSRQQVLLPRARKAVMPFSKEFRDWYLETEEARRKADMAKAALELAPPQIYGTPEKVFFRTDDGEWLPAQVLTSGDRGYVVRIDPPGKSTYTISGVRARQLRKAGPPAPKHARIPGDSPVCQMEGGCIDLILKSAGGSEHLARASMGSPFHHLFSKACAAIQDPWSCQTRMGFSHRGQWLNPHWRIFEAGLTNGTVLHMKLGPESLVPVSELSG